MSKTYTIVANGETFTATRGDVLLDAALIAGVDLPHDCRAGVCGSCAVTVCQGRLYGGECSEPRVVLACQARVIGNVEVMVEATPPVKTASGVVTGMSFLSSDVVEVRIEPSSPVEFLPGQYFRLKFRGCPDRCYTPTVPLERANDGHSMHFQIRRVADGRVSSMLGEEIGKHHRLKITGPFGSAYFRDHLTNRLVLIAMGTGFAPIWSIANAAIAENPYRHMVMVVGAELHRVALYGQGTVPYRAISQCQDHSRRIGPAKCDQGRASGQTDGLHSQAGRG